MSELFSEERIQEIMGENQKLMSRYVSCIHIDGSPILPPLIDDRYRNELTHYRNMAILVEKKIRDRKKLKDNRHSVDSGVIINASAGEPSWLRPCMLQSNQKELSTSHSFDSREKSSCETLCLHRSNSSDDTSTKHFIYDDDMWRYVSNCADEQISSAWFDNQAEELLSNFGAGLDANLSQSNLTSSNYSHIANESETRRTNSISDKSEQFMDKGSNAVARLSAFFQEYSEDIDVNVASKNVDSNSVCGKNDINEMFKSYGRQRVNQETERNYVFTPLNSESDCINECIHEHTLRNRRNDAMLHEKPSKFNNGLPTSECVPYFDNSEAISNRLRNDLECFKSNNSNKISSKENAVPEITHYTNSGKDPSSLFETILCESGIVNQGNFNIRCENNIEGISLKNKQKSNSPSIKISCSSISLPEFPSCPSGGVHQKQKPEKPYNPMFYGEGDNGRGTENNNQKVLRCDGATADVQKSWLFDKVTNTGSDDSREETFKNSVVVNSSYLENSSISQKCSPDVPLSESVSVSEIDFLSSSVATVPPDTSEDANELHNCQSSERDEITPPKLVRQNSYTLITPSPILLAHVKAAEKQEEKTLSEDDNSKRQLQNEAPIEIQDQLKTNENSKKGVKYVYAVPCKQSSIVVQNKMKSKGKRKDRSPQREKIVSLPGSAASSPVKVNLFHSSLDNLPIVTVRRFQELIDRKSSLKQSIHVSKTNIDGQGMLSGQRTLSNRSSSLDLQILNQTPVDDGLKCRSKSDLQESKGRPSAPLNLVHQEANKPKNDIEILFREASFNSSPSDFPLPETNDMSSPKSNQKDFYELSPDSKDRQCSSESHEKIEGNENTLVCSSLSSSGDTVQQIFLQLQNQHSQLMAQLLDRQKKEQEALANTFLNQQRQILLEMKLIPSSIDIQTTCANSDSGLCGTEKNSPLVQQDNQIFASVSVESHLSSFVEMPQSSRNSDNSRYNNSGATCNSMHHFSKELDVVIPSSLLQKAKSPVTEEQKNAAVIINAAARGYLVRRLLKTEYVQEIINTISESVQCALQLQRECPVDITPSDIELHRRLIQQLTAACYSLHDTFFTLSTQEKMNIIANDRDKRRNPSSRPVSARSSLSTATQKYIQRKQQQNRHCEQPTPNVRRSWWRSKARACSAGEAPSWLPQQYPACMLACPHPYRYVLSPM